MNKKLKIGIGVIIASTVSALLLWQFGPSWALAMSLLAAGIGCLVVCGQSRNKIISCFLASTLAVSPNVLAEDSYAGYSGERCYCFNPAAEGPESEQHVMVLNVILEPDATGEIAPRIVSVRHPDPATLVDYAGLNESLAAWGINLDGGLQYAKNGQSAGPEGMPFAFGDWSNPLSIHPEREQFSVVLEQANELGEFTMWQRVATFSAPAGMPIQIQDSPEGPSVFYRVRLQSPPEAFQAQGPILLGCGIGFLAGSAVIGVLVVRQCAKNKKKFEAMLPPKRTNDLENPMPPE